MTIPQMEPWLGDEETSAVHDYMKSGGWLMEFKKTREFEAAIASYVGSKHCVVTNNGTISLTLAALALGLRAGDEVLVPNFTMIASPNSLCLFGAVPKLVDVEAETLCMDVEAARAAITPKTRVIMLVTANGREPAPDIKAFEDLAREHDLVLLEDSAQSLGSRFRDGRHMGTAGAIGSFSFSVPKVITTGQGGALVTDDDDLAARLRRLKDFGRSSGGVDIHDTIGWNFKFTDIQACVGLEQMKKLPFRVGRKREIHELYRTGLQRVPNVELFGVGPNQTPWFIDIRCENREALREHLKAAGIGTRPMYPPVHQQKAYGWPGSYPVSERIGRDGLWLPSSSQLTNEEVETVCHAIAQFYAE